MSLHVNSVERNEQGNGVLDGSCLVFTHCQHILVAKLTRSTLSDRLVSTAFIITFTLIFNAMRDGDSYVKFC